MFVFTLGPFESVPTLVECKVPFWLKIGGGFLLCFSTIWGKSAQTVGVRIKVAHPLHTDHDKPHDPRLNVQFHHMIDI